MAVGTVKAADAAHVDEPTQIDLRPKLLPPDPVRQKPGLPEPRLGQKLGIFPCGQPAVPAELVQQLLHSHPPFLLFFIV